MNPLNRDLPNGYILIIKSKFAKRYRSNTILGRAFIVNTSDEKCEGAFEKKAGTKIYGAWLGDIKREIYRIDSDYISIRETNSFYAKYLPQLFTGMAIEFYYALHSILHEWVIENDNNEQTKYLSRLSTGKPLVDAYVAQLNKKEETPS